MIDNFTLISFISNPPRLRFQWAQGFVSSLIFIVLTSKLRSEIKNKNYWIME